MDIQSSTHVGSRALLYPNLSRGRAADPVVSADTTATNATLRTALDILRARLAESGVTLPAAPDPEEFSPERVADRILDFVGLALERAAPGEQGQVLAEARKGVEQGFREARDILESLDVLNGGIAANVDETYDRVMQGLDVLAGNAPAAGSEVQRAISATQSGSAQNGEVRIETREGDIVTVNFSRVSAQVEIAAASQSDNGSVYGTARASYQSAQLSYSVEGELNEEEQAAIDHLLHRVDKIADRFFAGNVQAAFQQASHLNVRGEQIAGYAFTLEHRSVQTAVNQYQSTQSNTVVPNGVPTGTQALADYANQVSDLLANPGAENLAVPSAAAGQLLDTNVALRALDEFGNTLNQGALSLLRDLLTYLVHGPESSDAESKLEAESENGMSPGVEATASDTTAAATEAPISAPENILLVA